MLSGRLIMRRSKQTRTRPEIPPRLPHRRAGELPILFEKQRESPTCTGVAVLQRHLTSRHAHVSRRQALQPNVRKISILSCVMNLMFCNRKKNN
jgi:hypothetical protein